MKATDADGMTFLMHAAASSSAYSRSNAFTMRNNNTMATPAPTRQQQQHQASTPSAAATLSWPVGGSGTLEAERPRTTVSASPQPLHRDAAVTSSQEIETPPVSSAIRGDKEDADVVRPRVQLEEDIGRVNEGEGESDIPLAVDDSGESVAGHSSSSNRCGVMWAVVVMRNVCLSVGVKGRF